MSQTQAKNLERHLQLSGEAIQMICQPLQKHFGVRSLVYKFLHESGHEISLTTDPAWLENYYHHELYKFSVLEKEPENYVKGQLLWSQIHSHKPILQAAYTHNIAHGMTLIRPQESGCEFYFLGAAQEDEKAGQLMMNNIDLLDQFVSYFQWKAEPLIKQAKRSPIHILGKYQKNQCTVNSIPCYQKKALRHGFLSDLYQEGLVIHLENSSVQLTKRELQVARELLMGRTMRETGDNLFISPRTVEVHVNNLKDKFNAAKKSILLQQLKTHLPDFV